MVQGTAGVAGVPPPRCLLLLPYLLGTGNCPHHPKGRSPRRVCTPITVHHPSQLSDCPPARLPRHSTCQPATL